MPEIFDVDLNLQKIKVDGQWMNISELAFELRDRALRGRGGLDRLAIAMDRLRAVLGNSELLQVRVTGEVADDYLRLSRRTGLSVGTLLSKALADFLTTDDAVDLLFDEEDATPLPRPNPATGVRVARRDTSDLEQTWFDTQPEYSEWSCAPSPSDTG